MSWAEKNQSPSSSSPITSLPEDIVVDILARVPRRDYPRVSLVSKHFRSLVSSREIYARRSSLGCTEHCIYLVLFDSDNGHNRLYTFRRKEKDKDSPCLVLIPGLPDMPRGGSYVAVGSRIYVFCEINSFFIDCTSHTVQHLPRMPVPMSNTAADVICGRIYVIGCISSKSKAMVVFDTQTQTWVTMPGMELYDNDVDAYTSLVVMGGKLYARGFQDNFAYDPKESKRETDEVVSLNYWDDENACVVDDVLYFYDWSGKLRAYDPERKCWVVVKGLDDLSAWTRRVGCFLGVTTSNYAGKLVLFFRSREIIGEICCAEISLERRKGCQIWGRIDQWWCDHASIAPIFYITKSLDVVL
ncbi:F-box/kelch-repeat protein [Raphanus sativus]|uniref:F-box/kelch-repeat protein At4g38940-like n=1 Tax=Raphanus sativus TaxID=3726 RepID=A0A6J0K7N8_RAPSA|nr:F-box/kelch-repeat protein At4g38940-like [Raphanus sativus]KAJ4884172.1 F-box/kelch-repeat protein [Raphanus sativus]